MDAELAQAEAVIDGLAGKIVPGCKALYRNWAEANQVVTVKRLCRCDQCGASGDVIWIVSHDGDSEDSDATESRLTRI